MSLQVVGDLRRERLASPMVWKDRQSTGVLIEKGSCVPDSEGMIHGETGSGDQFDEWEKLLNQDTGMLWSAAPGRETFGRSGSI